MNKNRHRIIFNAARGQRMVVAESASSVGAGSASGASGETSAPSSAMASLGDLDICKPSPLRDLALHPLTLSIGLALTLGLVFVTTARAQIVADPSAPGNQRPTILQTGNGLPQINIQSPSAAGVSRNTYSQFDVDSRGAILNNSRTNVQTQTGGMIAGNPWLSTGEARVILNEVRSSNPSYLNGYIEVAGRRAEVIVANPAGIQVNGGGFINAAGVTLTTGVPVMNNGHLESFRVGGGKVRIEGLGLDTSTADYTAILARAMEVNAGLWAKNLTVVTGTNEVKALATGDATQVTKIAGSGTETTPNFMLDVAAIGGMYAGKIFLKGTEAGLGVNNRGSLIAQEGEWVLKADGSLINTGKLQAKGDLSVQTSGAISNTGPDALISSQGNASIHAGNTVANTSQAQIVASGTLSVIAVGALDNSAGTLAADGAVQVAATGINNTQGSMVSAQSTLSLNSGAQALTNTQGNLEAAQAIAITSGALNNHQGLIQSIDTLNITATGDLNNTQGAVVAGGAMNVSAQDIDNTQGEVTAHQGATLTSEALTNQQGVIQAVNTLNVRASGNLDNTEGTVVSGGHAQITAADIDNTRGTLAADQNLTLDSAVLNNHQGTVQALQTLNIDTQGQALTNTQGLMVAAGSMVIEAGAIDNTLGTVAAQQNATLTSTALNNDKGLIQAVGTLDIDTQGHTLTNTNASGHGSGAGGIVAGAAASLTTGAFNNTAGEVLSTGTLTVDTTGALTNVTGRLQGVGATDIDTHGQALDNTAGRVASQATLAVTTGVLTNNAQAGQGGMIGSQGNLTVHAGATTNGAVAASGAARSNIWSAQTASVTASSFSNAGVLSGGHVTLNTTTDLNNAAGASIEANGNLTVTVTGANLNNAGHLIANQTLSVHAKDITNTGSLEATDHVLTATGTFANAAGASITASNAIDIGAVTLSNRGLINANEATGTAPASLVHIHATTVNNLGTGAIFGDRIAIAADTLNNRPEGGVAPVIAAREQLDIGAQTLNNEDSAILYSGGHAAIGGSLDAALVATGQMQALNNISADIEVTGDLRISALTLTNQRRGASVSQVQMADETATLTMPSWWVNGKNYGWLTNTSNYSTRQYYLLDPASIVSETPLVTPDGNLIYKIEVRLDPSDSVYQLASGSYNGAYGARDRITVGAGTAVLYVEERRTGVSNPDQVAGAPDAFTPNLAAVGEWQHNALSYNNAYGRCTTNCTLLVVQTGYTDPSSTILRDTQRNITGGHDGFEISRTSHHTVVEDRLNPGAGAAAAIRSGGGMQLNIGSALTNSFADIQAGGVLDVQATGATVTNTGQTLKRTHRFQITSTTVTEDTFGWTAPEISEVIGQAGGNLSGAQQLNITAKSLTNSDLARSTGLPTSGLGFLGVSLPTASTPITVPNNALFQPATPGSTHLIQGAPGFAGYRTWLGSDYLIANLGADPNALQKRLGDGFYEQKLIREQVAQLTGRRFLDGYANDEAQYRALMDSGLTYAQQWNLVPGIGLTAAQMALLTTDLVWLVEREVVLPDGTKTIALVPQLYVRQVPEGDFQASGALLSGNQVNLQIQEDLVNAGGRIEGGVVIAQAGRDLANIGGLMQARSELLASAGRNVTISSPTHTTSFAGNVINQSRTELAAIGEMKVGNAAGAKLSIEAGGNVALQAASVSNASTSGSTAIRADGEVRLETVTVGSSDNTEYNAKNYQRHSQSQEIGTSVAAMGDITISAGDSVVARAATVQALGDLSVTAINDIVLEAGRQTSDSATSVYSKRSGPLSKKSSEEVKNSTSDVAIGSSFSGGNVVMEAKRDIQIQGSSVNAQDLLLLDAKRDVLITSEQNTESGSYFKETKKSGFSADVMDGVSYGKSHQNANQTYSAVTQSGSSVTGGDVIVQAGRDAVVRSSVVIADADLTVIAGRDVRVEAAADTLTSSNEAHSKSTTIGIEAGASGRFTGFGQAKSNQNGTSTGETAVQSLLSANGGSLTLIAGTDSQYQGTGSGNVNTQGGTLLAQDTVALSGNSVTLGTADSESNSEFHAQSKNFTIGSQLTGVVGGLITQIGDAVQTARNSDNDRLQAAAALKAGYDAYKLADKTGADFTAAAGTVEKPGDPSAGAFGVSASIGSSKSHQDEWQTTTQQAGTVIQAGQIDIQAREGDLKAVGAKLQAQDIALQAQGDIDLQAAKNTAELHSTNSGGSAGLGVTVGFGEQNGISFQASASKSRGNADGSEVTHDNTVVTATNTLTVRSGADTNLRGAELAGNTVIADIGGDLNIQTLQDTSHYESDQKSSGLSVSVCVPPICYGTMVTGSISMSKEQIDHDFQSAKTQSGIAAGEGGFDIAVAGNTDLQGGAITSSATPDKNKLATGSLTYSDLTNTQTTYAESESVSVGYGGGSALATVGSNVVGNVLGNEMGGKGLPENITQTSSTLSVISPANITITGNDENSAENVAALTNRDASKANESLTNQLTLQQAQELKARQEKERENQIAANYVGAVVTNVIGDVAQAQGWADGSWQKTALHGMAGLIQAKVAGTDPGKAMAAAMLNEQMLPVLDEYLRNQGITPTDEKTKAEYRALMEAGSALLGSVFDAAHVTYTATVNNYLKHIEQDKKKEQLAACKTDECRSGVEAYWDKVSQDRNAEKESSCLEKGAEQCRANIAEMQQDFKDLQAAVGDPSKGITGLTPEERNNIKQVMAQTRNNLEIMAALGNEQLGTTNASPDELVAAGFLTPHEGELLKAARAGSMINFLGAIYLPTGLKANPVRTAGKTTQDEVAPAPGKATEPAKTDVEFKTLGLNVEATRLPDGVKMVRELEKSGLSPEAAKIKAEDFISSGSTPPVARQLDTAEKLVKVVPAGGAPSATTGYWMTESEFIALRQSPASMANKLGLPPGMHVDSFDVFQITPKSGAVVFESTIAPTTVNGTVSTTGGAKQTIVVDRSQFTLPVKVGTVSVK